MGIDSEQKEIPIVFKRNSIDPSLNPDHLTPGGKRKKKQIDREEQQRRFEQTVEDHTSDIIPTELPVPGPNRKPRKRKIMGIDTD